MGAWKTKGAPASARPHTASSASKRLHNWSTKGERSVRPCNACWHFRSKLATLLANSAATLEGAHFSSRTAVHRRLRDSIFWLISVAKVEGTTTCVSSGCGTSATPPPWPKPDARRAAARPPSSSSTRRHNCSNRSIPWLNRPANACTAETSALAASCPTALPLNTKLHFVSKASMLPTTRATAASNGCTAATVPELIARSHKS
mmetsp:Transcript_21603/g.64348  ORF Transcript_21603/g.64348 Transcript_21603/m.64348 type:complete len:204 (-) Transcript_21603:1613-2224(-)